MTSVPHSQSGISLVELMIALTLGLLVVLGIGNAFLANKQTYRLQEAQSRLQESARFAVNILTQSIREASFRGCAKNSSVTNTLNTPTGYLNNFAVGIQGSEWVGGTSTATTATNWSPALDSSVTSPAPGSDVITIRGPTGLSVTVTGPQASGALPVSANSLNQCDVLMISDCNQTVVSQVTSSSAATALKFATGASCTAGTTSVAPGNASAPTLTTVSFGATVTPVATTTYYIRESSSTPTTPKEYSLWRKVGTNNPEELIEGIENMQILYGVDTVADETANAPNLISDRYMTAVNVQKLLTTYPSLVTPTVAGATAVSDPWTRVTNIRLNLLVRTVAQLNGTSGEGGKLTEQTQSYYFDVDSDGSPEAISAQDYRLRRAFTTTVGLRNRLQ